MLLQYIIRRIFILVPLLAIISIIAFVIIQLPPGDFLSMEVMRLRASGTHVADEEINLLRMQYGLDKSLPEQYLIWITGIVTRGDFGTSLQLNRKVSEILTERIPLTALVTILTTILVWLIAVPIGIYSATHQYSPFDYFWTFVGFIGLATPGFLIALVFMWIAFSKFGITAVGLMSPQYETAPWNIEKMIDVLKHLLVPIIILTLGGTAGLIRTMRSMMLDELNKQYVITARAKGLKETTLLLKYPVRTALNPVTSTLGWMLPALISGEVLVSYVLNIPTTGPVLMKALLNQDMYLAGSIVFILSILTVVGTLVSDIFLTWLDPRIRYEGGAR
jgi:peptide/nickel transport system permease protein